MISAQCSLLSRRLAQWLRLLLSLIMIVGASVACSPRQDASLQPLYDPASAAPIPAKPSVPYKAERQLLWGDLHVHTSYSTDAYTMGVRALPDDAYRFARGGEIAHALGYGIKLARPLDFLGVTDHAEFLGVVRDRYPDLHAGERSLRERTERGSRLANTWYFIRANFGFSLKDIDASLDDPAIYDTWRETIAAAERHYKPGEFTSFVAYEWSSMPDGDNLHRNVIYRSADVPARPFSSLDSDDPRDLWAELDRQRQQGMQVMAIPHNGNVSNGRMYDAVAFDGSQLDADYAAARNRNEPVSEIFQVKGASETYPSLSPDDAFADFEIYDTRLSATQSYSKPEGSYARDGLRRGLAFKAREGFNPYRFGVIGSSDGHNASSPVEEDNYHGKLPRLDGSASWRLGTAHYLPKSMAGGIRWGSGGLAAVWAESNTRESIFDAMSRREAYATSGPRIALRFFAGWELPKDLVSQPDWLETAYQLAVPMGGQLAALPAAAPSDAEHSDTEHSEAANTGVENTRAAAPSFLLSAMKDPEGANLDRIQIIKGWVDSTGQTQERIYDVAWSGDRQTAAGLQAVGNTVDAATARYSNSIGAAQLQTVWRDPDFDAAQSAFYYARVLEIPTPRWSTYDALAVGIEAPQPVAIQERAVSSAIWYESGRYEAGR